MKELEEKFLVINHKRFDELNECSSKITCNCREAFCNHMSVFPEDCKEIKSFKKSLNNFVNAYEKRTGKKLNQKYLVCNQDEPYADKIKDIILSN